MRIRLHRLHEICEGKLSYRAVVLYPFKVRNVGARNNGSKSATSLSLSQSAVHCRSHDNKEMTSEGIYSGNIIPFRSVIDQLKVSTCAILFLGTVYSLSNRKRMVSTLCCGFKKLFGSSHRSNLDEGYPSRDEYAFSCKFEFMWITI